MDKAVEDGWLSRLPGELRNQIYGDLVSCGELAMTRTNSRVGEEMFGLVDEKIWYRMFINYPKGAGYRSRPPDRRSGECVQNVEVRWRLPESVNGYWEDGESIAAFDWDPRISRRCCSVYLERGSYRGTWIRGRDLIGWSRLAVFEEVVFRVEMKGKGDFGDEQWWCKAMHDRSVSAPLGVVCRCLKLCLGDGEEGSDSDGRWLKFHPGRMAVAGDIRDGELDGDVNAVYVV